MEGLRKEVMRVQEENEKEKAKKCLRKEEYQQDGRRREGGRM